MSKNAKTEGQTDDQTPGSNRNHQRSQMSPDQAQRTYQINITYTPNQARKIWQIRLKLHAKSVSKNTPNQAQITRQIRLEKRAKSGSNYARNQVTNTCCMLQIRSKKERKETRTRLSVPANFAAQKRQLTKNLSAKPRRLYLPLTGRLQQ